jgi:hypothetical protein
MTWPNVLQLHADSQSSAVGQRKSPLLILLSTILEYQQDGAQWAR